MSAFRTEADAAPGRACPLMTQADIGHASRSVWAATGSHVTARRTGEPLNWAVNCLIQIKPIQGAVSYPSSHAQSPLIGPAPIH